VAAQEQPDPEESGGHVEKRGDALDRNQRLRLVVAGSPVAASPWNAPARGRWRSSSTRGCAEAGRHGRRRRARPPEARTPSRRSHRPVRRAEFPPVPDRRRRRPVRDKGRTK
jgi:hypothetical protein